MTIRDQDISERVTEWLDRFAVPMHFRDKPEAAQKEAEAILRMFLRYAPKMDYPAFINRVFDRIDYQKKDRFWPTPHDVGAACVNVSKESPKQEATADLDMSPEAIMGRRMSRGESVGEDWLWGRLAVDLIAKGMVDQATMEAYRKAAFFARRDVQGEEAALAWEADAKERHDAARALYRERNEPRRKWNTSFTPKTLNPEPAE